MVMIVLSIRCILDHFVKFLDKSRTSIFHDVYLTPLNLNTCLHLARTSKSFSACMKSNYPRNQVNFSSFSEVTVPMKWLAWSVSQWTLRGCTALASAPSPCSRRPRRPPRQRSLPWRPPSVSGEWLHEDKFATLCCVYSWLYLWLHISKR